MLINVFTYGALMFPEVWGRVVRGQYRSASATLQNYARFAIEGETYPGMIEQADATVDGVVYFDVDVADLAALDAFEGDDYRRATLAAILDTGEPVSVGTYVYLPVARLSSRPWLPESFEMARFLDTYCRDKLGY